MRERVRIDALGGCRIVAFLQVRPFPSENCDDGGAGGMPDTVALVEGPLRE
jgi:hypothetical protein